MSFFHDDCDIEESDESGYGFDCRTHRFRRIVRWFVRLFSFLR